MFVVGGKTFAHDLASETRVGRIAGDESLKIGRGLGINGKELWGDLAATLGDDGAGISIISGGRNFTIKIAAEYATIIGVTIFLASIISISGTSE